MTVTTYAGFVQSSQTVKRITLAVFSRIAKIFKYLPKDRKLHTFFTHFWQKFRESNAFTKVTPMEIPY